MRFFIVFAIIAAILCALAVAEESNQQEWIRNKRQFGFNPYYGGGFGGFGRPGFGGGYYGRPGFGGGFYGRPGFGGGLFRPGFGFYG
ncbi:keratin, type II cytoskeletal 1-like [Teleopsis dalmanni]|uniref:keratin, type II cytoskeletal 1-like n=1 Tax=Teleopsis dalmanni TaxID=139649 RepID=UPI0018CD560D|nr:keratin, type II cytoskeletal 1-like [Teleopsis dalmanni]